MKTLKVNCVQNVSRECVVCGTHNPFSLQTKFFECENNVLMGRVRGEDHHQSYPGRMHGGMISAIIDETVGRAVQIGAPDIWGVTGELKIRYVKPTPLGVDLHCFAKLTMNNSRIFKGVAILETATGELVATGEATYFKMTIDKISDGFGDDDWYHEDMEMPIYVNLYNDEALEKLCNK
ncbi:MAG: PaaI family thioesterase [Clostridia bacterium]|nr:PaaI family thioesterase [Clostridia bacterium]